MLKVANVVKKLKSYVPETVPRTEAGLTAWIDEVLELASVPVNNSTRHAIAAQLMHMPERKTTSSKHYFVKTLQRAIINQCAFNVMEDFKAQDKAAREALKAEGPASTDAQMVSKA